MPCRNDNCCPNDDLEGFGFNDNFSNLEECTVITISTTELDEATIGVEYEFTLSSSGGRSPVRWSIVSGALPDGLSLSEGGVISGVPEESGTFTIRVIVMDANGAFCRETLSMEVVTVIPPLHNAVYDSGRDVIFAVRGGTVYKLNSSTGAVITSSRYNKGPCLSDSYIALDTGRDKLWVTYSVGGFVAPPGNQTPTNDKFIYKLNPDTFAIEQTIGIDAQNIESGLSSYIANNVMRHIISNGVQLAFWIGAASSTNGMDFVVFNPDSLPGALFVRSAPSGARWGFAAIYPSSTDYQYASDNEFNSGVTRRTNANVFVENSGGYPVIGNNTTLPITARIYGFAFVQSSNRLYCANRSNLILKLNASVEEVGTAIDVGGAGTTDIWNVRRRASDGKLYCPDIGGDKVFIIDTASGDSVTTKTGFDTPWDVVFTSSKAWAVQQTVPGLKEIT